MISASKIAGFLPDKYNNLSITLFDSIDSTNRIAKEEAGSALPRLVVADSQTAGRGRLGRSFFSPSGTGIYMSVAIGGFPALSDAVFTTSAAAVAVTDAILTLTGKETGIKWVNDVYFDGKKICGILAESVFSGENVVVVVGIGLNLSTADFPAEISGVAGSLGTSISREQFIAEITKNLLDLCESPGTFMEKCRARSIVLGKEINYFYGNEKKSAFAVDIDEKGGLVVRNSSGNLTTLSSGEITVRLK